MNRNGRPGASGTHASHKARMAFGLTALLLLTACGERELILPGERFPVRADLSASAATADNPNPRAPAESRAAGSQPVSLPAMVSNAEWAQRGGNARHVAPHAALSANPRLAWAADIGSGSSRRQRIAAAPIVAGGRVFTIDAGQVVSATSTSGARLWQKDLTPPGDRGSQVSGGGLAAEGGRVFASTGYGEVIALDAASGNVLWRQSLGSPVQGAPSVENGVVYATGRDGAAWAINATNGKVIWQVIATPGAAGYLGTSAPTVGDRSVIFPSGAGELTSVLKIGGGTKLWQESLAGKRLGRAYAQSADITGDPALVGRTVYAGTAAGRTVALDVESGEKIWSAGEGALGPLAVAGGSLFLVNDQARLVRLDAATGAKIWEIQLPYFQAEKVKRHKAIFAHYGPVLAGGKLWVASSDGRLRGFSPVNGALLAETDLPGGAATQPAVAGGTLYVVSTNGQLLAFR